MAEEARFRQVRLDAGHHVAVGRLPESLRGDAARFEALWALHPPTRPVIRIHGRHTPIPRWQQAYGRDYRFSDQWSRAAPVPPLLQPWLDWARAAVSPALNGLLLNWYDGARGDYIGRHRDSTAGLVPDVPIATIALGECRTFRLQRWRGRERVDFAMEDGAVILIPPATNAVWTHAVPKSARARGRRISITLRAFLDGGAGGGHGPPAPGSSIR